jgi:hypothetical protein
MKAKTSVGPQAEGNDHTDRARRRFLQNSTAATLVAMCPQPVVWQTHSYRGPGDKNWVCGASHWCIGAFR